MDSFFAVPCVFPLKHRPDRLDIAVDIHIGKERFGRSYEQEEKAQ